MKGEITRRAFLKGISGAVVFPSIVTGLDRATHKLANSSDKLISDLQESNERLEWIVDVWRVSGRKVVGVEGWNESGLWSFYCNSSTGEVISGIHFDYRDVPFMKYDGYKFKTLSQLRAEGTSWGEINRLHYEGFARNPGYKFVS